MERAGIENPDRLIAAGAGEAAVQLGDQRHPMHAGRVGDLAHEGARIGVDHDHARAAGDVEPVAGRVESEVVPAPVAAERVAAYDVIRARLRHGALRAGEQGDEEDEWFAHRVQWIE